MAAVCYILFSESVNKFYIGATHVNIEVRLEKHIEQGYGNQHFTVIANDWVIFLTLEANDYAHAVRMERKIKAMKSKTYIMNLKKYAELREKLINSTRI